MTGGALTARQVPVSAALLDPIRSSPAWLAESLNALSGGLRPTIPARAALNPRQRQAVEEMCSRLAIHLAPADPVEVGKGVALLDPQFQSGRGRDDLREEARAEGYLIALDGVPLFALREAVRLVLSGHAEGISPRFMPTSAELRRLVDELSRPARWHANQLRRLLDADVEREITPEERARVAERFQSLVRGAAHG